jgi:hypothetical protein
MRWMELRMKFSAACLQCGASRGVPLLRVVMTQTLDVYVKSLEQRDAALLQNECSDDVWN